VLGFFVVGVLGFFVVGVLGAREYTPRRSVGHGRVGHGTAGHGRDLEPTVCVNM
jgi:hypothetical protein